MHDSYVSGEYLQKNPTWHIEDSPWKAMQIARMLERNTIEPLTICEVGCGAGEILSQLQKSLDPRCVFWGYEVSPQALEFCKTRANEKLHCKLGDICEEKDVFFDVILLIDLLEHLDDYLGFLSGHQTEKPVQDPAHSARDLSPSCFTPSPAFEVASRCGARALPYQGGRT